MPKKVDGFHQRVIKQGQIVESIMHHCLLWRSHRTSQHTSQRREHGLQGKGLWSSKGCWVTVTHVTNAPGTRAHTVPFVP